MEAAVGQHPVVARPHQEIATALAAVRTGQAEVRDPPEPHVVDHSEDPDGASIDGTSITIGPSDKSRNPQK